MQITVTTDADVVDPADGETSLREAVARANDSPGTDRITFDPGLSGATLRLAQGEIVITDSLVIDGDLDDDAAPDIRITGDADGDDVLDADGNTDAGASRPEEDAANGEDDDGDGVIDDAGPDLMADNSRIFAVSNPNADLAIDGLILTGGLAEDFTGVVGGGGAVCAAHSLSLVNSTVAGNASTGSGPGGGLDVDFALTLYNVTLSGNIARSQGGGAYSEYSVVVVGSTISDNISNAQGGGISSDYTIAITDSTVSGNIAANRGGGLYADVLVDVVDSAFSGNTGDDGGAVAAGDGVARVFGSSFTGNSARDEGGAVYGDPRVEAFDSTFTGNTAYRDGGAIAADETVLVRSSMFADNVSGARGGAVYGDYEVRIESSTLTGNQADQRGGAVYADELTIIRDSTLSGNSVLGLGAYSFGGGGAVAADGMIRASASSFTANSALGPERSSGGALYAEVVEIVASTVSGNATTGENSGGGGIFGEEQVVLVDSTVSANRTEGANAPGGGVFGGFVLGLGSLVSDNATTGDGAAGGGIFAGGVNGSGGLTLVNSTLAGNSTAGETSPGGGAYARDRLEGVQISVTGNAIAGPIVPPQGQGDAGGGGLALGPSADARLFLANSIVLGNAATDPSATGAEIGGDPQPQPARAFFEGLNIVGADPAAFDPTTANPYLGGGADAVINADPNAVFAATAGTLSDEDADATPESPTGVTRGALADNGGARHSVALAAGAGNPALDAADSAAALVLSELLLGADLDGDGDRLDLIDSVADLANDSRGAFFPRTTEQPGAGGGPDLGAFELGRPSAFSFGVSDGAGEEGDAGTTDLTFEVTRAGGLGYAMTVEVAVAGSGAAPADAADFAGGALPAATLSFAPGETAQTATVAVAGDTDVEPDERFTVSLSNPSGNPLGATASGSRAGLIRNDDAPPPGPDLPPIARDDIAATPEGAPVTIPVLDNDADPEGGALSVAALGTRPAFGGIPASGLARIDGDTITYTPDPGFAGTVAFSYEVTDPAGGTAAASVTVVVGTLPPATPAPELLRGSAGADLITPAGAGTYLGGAGTDSYLLSQGIRPGGLVLLEDSGPSRIELAEGLAIASATLLSDDLSLILANGAELRIFGVADDSFALSANATTGDSGAVVDYEGFADALFGETVPQSGAVVTGPALLGPPAAPSVLEPLDDGLLIG